MSDVPNVSSSMQRIMQAVQTTKTAEQTRAIAQQESEQTLSETLSPTASLRPGRQRDIKTRSDKMGKAQQIREKGINLPLERIKGLAERFERENPELKSKALLALKELIKPGDTKEEIIEKIRRFFEDVTLMDEALDFLIQTSDGDLKALLISIKESLMMEYGREIQAGKNISFLAQQAAEQGLGTPAALRDLYRDITGNPRESTTLFEELADRYTYKKLREVINFLLHSVGTDLKSKGPSIPRGLLHNLLQEARALQAILGVYNFFKGRMPLIENLLKKGKLPIPPELQFETMSRHFMHLVQDRYPNADKVLSGAQKLGIDKSVLAKIIAFSQLRDGVREVALHQVYRSVQHREEVLIAIISALEILEDQFEEEINKDMDEKEDEDF